jgi:hypothetical protein
MMLVKTVGETVVMNKKTIKKHRYGILGTLEKKSLFEAKLCCL